MKNSDEELLFSSPRFYRDGERGLILGVCAGVAEFFGLPVGRVRLLAALPLLFPPFTIPAVLGYLVMGFMLPLRPPELRLGEAAEAFRNALRESPEQAFLMIELYLKRSRRRVERLEAYVSSPEFDLFRRMRDKMDARDGWRRAEE